MKFDPTPLIRPNFHGPLVAVLTGFHCNNNNKNKNNNNNNKIIIIIITK